MTLAVNLAQALNCQAAERPCGQCDSCQKTAQGKHADVQVIGLPPGGSEISIDQVREVQRSSCLPPFEGKHKVFIIDGGELLSTEAANCLLKTLEEPAGGVVFIVLATSTSALPITVVSRCQLLVLYPVPTPEIATALTQRWSVDGEKAELLARLCRGCPGWAVAAATDDTRLQQRAERLEWLLGAVAGGYDERLGLATRLVESANRNRGLLRETLGLWLEWWRDLLLVKLGCNDAITNIDREARLAELAAGYTLPQIRAAIGGIQAAAEQLRQNANPRLVFEVLMMDIPPGGNN
jgi:DNA polymerase-3 subunit delta'